MTEVIEQLKLRIEELKDSLHRHYSIEVESRLSELERTVTILCSCAPINEDFESEWKRYCDFKGGGAVTMNIKDVAKHFAQWQREHMIRDAVDAEIAEGSPMPFQFSIPVLKNTDMMLLCKDKFRVGDKVKVIIILRSEI